MAYDAFVSYSHEADEPLASALEHGLQRLARPWNQRRGMSVFRDAGNLNLSAHLWGSIQQALDDSRFLIFVASPASASSPWVAREIEVLADAPRRRAAHHRALRRIAHVGLRARRLRRPAVDGDPGLAARRLSRGTLLPRHALGAIRPPRVTRERSIQAAGRPDCCGAQGRGGRRRHRRRGGATPPDDPDPEHRHCLSRCVDPCGGGVCGVRVESARRRHPIGAVGAAFSRRGAGFRVRGGAAAKRGPARAEGGGCVRSGRDGQSRRSRPGARACGSRGVRRPRRAGTGEHA